MAFTTDTVIDQINIDEWGSVSVRVQRRTFEDGEQVGERNLRYVIHPGDDFSARPPRVRAVCQLFHTQRAIDDWNNRPRPALP